jgi:hypothetical protein
MPNPLGAANLLAADVLLYRGEDWLGKAIRFFDGSEVNHAGLFLGNRDVAEALAGGLERRDLAVSVAGHSRVLARRLRHTPTTMQPVLDRAAWYLGDSHRYGYEQLLLLAFLTLTRKPKVTPVLRVLVRKVLDSAASLLTRMSAANREPMICSEFVFRCYDEALPTAGDEYSLEINGLAANARVALPEKLAAASGAPRLRGRGIHLESLLALTVSRSSRAWRAPLPTAPEEGAGLAARAAAVNPAEIDALIEQYLDEAVPIGAATAEAAARSTRRTARPRAAAAETASDSELQRAVLGFAAALATRGAAAEPRTALVGGAPASALDRLFHTAADFVTPGDLAHTDDLFTAGDVSLTP